MKLKTIIFTTGCVLGMTSPLSFASDNLNEKRKKHTVSLGYVYTDVSGSISSKYDSFRTGTSSEILDSMNWQDGGSLKYRYEFTDTWGGMVSWTNSSRKVGQNNASKELNYSSLMAGPTHRLNEYFSTYALLGVSMGEYKQKTGNNNSATSAKALGGGVGIQINPVNYLSVDLGYEFSRIKFDKNLKGNYNSWIVSAGYRF